MIAIYIKPDAMTAEQHSEGRRRLSEAGVSEAAMKLHSVFGEDGKLEVFDIWESQEAWDEFLGHLVPILQELGITMSAPPVIMPLVDLVQQ
jgi:hypothetical protein